MKEPFYRNFYLVIFSGFLFFVAEFIIKNLVIGMSSVQKVTSWFAIAYTANTEMAFSIPINSGILIAMGLLVLLGLLQYFTVCCRDGLYGHVWSVNLILWGAFSNMYDRLTRGFVVDYLQVGGWPVFNLADIAIAAGLISLLYFISKEDRNNVYQLKEA